jgi:hypothetical protein
VKTVIAFYSREYEKFALAAALGAIQERASIRMRRLDPAAGDANFEQEYIAPRDIDTEWAEVILIASPEVPELREYLESMPRLNANVSVVRLECDVESARLAARRAAKKQ